MSRIEEAQEILRALGLPKAQQNEIAALTLLALARISPEELLGHRADDTLSHLIRYVCRYKDVGDHSSLLPPVEHVEENAGENHA
jgi:hypothetical protein